MAKNNNDILRTVRSKGLARPSAGLDVPEGYFEDFAGRLAASLPERPEIESTSVSEAPRGIWAQVRPYIYMAAMFAGVWCMLQMFTSLAGINKLKPIQENTILAKALANDNFMMDYIYDDLNEWDIVDEMMEDGTLDVAGTDTSAEPEMCVMPDGDADYILPQ